MIPEILAPAGSMEALRAAVSAGADAVYLGGSRFGARAYADNFGEAELLEAIAYCHRYGVKVYLTGNTLFRNGEMKELYGYLAPLYEAGLDAVIVQDLGVMSYLNQQFPGLPLHASTQMSITTGYAYRLLKDYGVTRIVPARELSMEEIKSLKAGENAPEVEVFVQGALCYCYSGHCLFSSLLGGRSGNRGRCAQTCRLPYTLWDREGNRIDYNGGEYLLSTKDLCGLEAVPELIAAGVDSFKIEGRMKRPEYVAACVRTYRRAVDACRKGEFNRKLVEDGQREMAEVFNRGGFTKGYYHQKNGESMMSVKSPKNAGVCIGEMEHSGRNRLEIRLSGDVEKGDLFVVEGNEEEVLTAAEGMKRGQLLVLNTSGRQKDCGNKKVFRVRNAQLEQELKQYTASSGEITLRGKAEFIVGKPAVLTVFGNCGGREYKIAAKGMVVQEAAKNPVIEETIYAKLCQTGGTGFHFEEMQISLSENAFYPMKELKELRRGAIKQLEESVLGQFRREKVERLSEEELEEVQEMLRQKSEQKTRQNFEQNSERNSKQDSEEGRVPEEVACRISVMVSDLDQLAIAVSESRIAEIYLDLQYFEKEDIIREIMKSRKQDKRLYLALPPVLRQDYIAEIQEILDRTADRLGGVVARNLDELAWLYERGYSGNVVTDYSLYVMNNQAGNFIRRYFKRARITLPVELNEAQLKSLLCKDGDWEMTVYGRQQLMVSAQCPQETVKGCNGKNPAFVLKDRYQKEFPVRGICKYCYTLYYNSLPTVLFDCMEDAVWGKVNRRLHFTMESGKEMRRVLHTFFTGEKYDGERTRGHYRRGVE